MRNADLEGSELVGIYAECERSDNWTAFYARVQRIQAEALAEGQNREREAWKDALELLISSAYADVTLIAQQRKPPQCTFIVPHDDGWLHCVRGQDHDGAHETGYTHQPDPDQWMAKSSEGG